MTVCAWRLDLTEEWDKLDNGSALITGVIVARSDFVEAHPAAVGSFLRLRRKRGLGQRQHRRRRRALIGEYGIVDAAVAEKGPALLQYCLHHRAELLEKLPGYLCVCNADPAAVGGAMPDNSFYFASSFRRRAL